MQTILYIEDRLGGSDGGIALLATDRRRVVSARADQDGVALARELEADLILLDMSLPDLAGLLTLDRLKVDAATRTIPVIVMSSQSIEEMPGLERGLIVAYVGKPVDLTKLLALVERILAQPARRSWRCTVCASEWLRPTADPPDRNARCIRCDGQLTLIEAT